MRKYLFKKGDRVRSVGGTSNCREQGRTATIKRIKRSMSDKKYYIVEWDDGDGWEDTKYGGTGWNIQEHELELIDPTYPGYDIDA